MTDERDATAEGTDPTGDTTRGSTAEATAEETAAPSGAGATDDAGANGQAGGAGTSAGTGERLDLRAVLKQLTTPMLESLDARLREQVEAHTDELLQGKVDAAVADRLSTVDRAIADLSRAVEALERRIEASERRGEPLDDA